MFDLYNILPCRYKNNSFFFICITTALKSVIMVHISVIYIIKGFEINRLLTSLLSFYAFFRLGRNQVTNPSSGMNAQTL